MRTAPALAVALLASVLAVPTAEAVSETCRGQAATIVGEPGASVTGTNGDDVIVTNGATFIYAQAGDDTICATQDRRIVLLDAGKGADLVDTTAVGSNTHTILGLGEDELYGGPGIDFVETGKEGGYDRDRDRIETGDGNDSVFTGNTGFVNPDDVDLGTGPGLLDLNGDQATGVLRAAPGSTARINLSPHAAGAWVINDRVDRATLDGAPMVSWANLHVFRVDGPPRAHFRFVGTDRKDSVELRGRIDGVDLGEGADFVSLQPVGGVSGSFLGGPGTDLLQIQSAEVLADLNDGRFGTHISRASARIAGFEDFYVQSTRAWLHGSAAPNWIRFSACIATVRGGEASDKVIDLGAATGCSDRPQRELGTREYGGPGDDVLHGSTYADRIVGGPGQDRADGRKGRDTCRAEHEVSCES